jgi:hypothetical protein
MSLFAQLPLNPYQILRVTFVSSFQTPSRGFIRVQVKFIVSTVVVPKQPGMPSLLDNFHETSL